MYSRKNKVVVLIILLKTFKIVLIIKPSSQTKTLQNRQALFEMMPTNTEEV